MFLKAKTDTEEHILTKKTFLKQKQTSRTQSSKENISAKQKTKHSRTHSNNENVLKTKTE